MSETELKEKLDKLTETIVSCYMWKNEAPGRVVDVAGMAEDFLNLLDGAFYPDVDD